MVRKGEFAKGRLKGRPRDGRERGSVEGWWEKPREEERKRERDREGKSWQASGLAAASHRQAPVAYSGLVPINAVTRRVALPFHHRELSPISAIRISALILRRILPNSQ